MACVTVGFAQVKGNWEPLPGSITSRLLVQECVLLSSFYFHRSKAASCFQLLFFIWFVIYIIKSSIV